MFTGLIEEIGKVSSIIKLGNAFKIKIECNRILDDVKIDDSVSINGACQTVISVGSNYFEVDTIEETIRKTTLGKFRVGQNVNLERAMQLKSRFGGHIVQGHIDCVGSIIQIKNETIGKNYSIKYPDIFSKYLIDTGSITVNGVSLTTSSVNNEFFTVSLIPHTIESTIFKYLEMGDSVNLEFDVIGKYIEKLLSDKQSQNNKDKFWEKYLDQPY